MRIDLHVHTTASDGLLEPTALVRAVRTAGVQVFSVADHDTVDGLDEAKRAADAAGLTFVPGVELSAYWRTVEFHILGYFIDPASAALRAFLANTREARHVRLHAMLTRLQAMGMRRLGGRRADAGPGRQRGTPASGAHAGGARLRGQHR